MTTSVPSPGLPPAGAGDSSADSAADFLADSVAGSVLDSWADSSAGISPVRRVAVIGLGLIGGSLARDLATAAEIELVGWDADAATRDLAQAAGISVVNTLAECVAGEPDLVVLAVPLAAMVDVCRELSPLMGGGTLVTDVGSVKAPVREVMESEGLAQRYLGSHPMAGTEASGFAAAVSGLFRDAAWVLTVDEASAPGVDGMQVLAVAELVTRTLGCRVYLLTDDQHDEAVALVSHLPHVFAAALLGQAALSPVHDVALSLAAGSFRDGTRVAGTNPARTEAMVTGNAAWVAPLVEQGAAQLQALATQLRSGADVSAFFAPDAPAAEGPAADAPVPGAQATTAAGGTPSASDTGFASDAASATESASGTGRAPGTGISSGTDRASGAESAPGTGSASGAGSASGTESASGAEIVDAADLDWHELRTFLFDATARGRAIRSVDLASRTLTLAPQRPAPQTPAPQIS